MRIRTFSPLVETTRLSGWLFSEEIRKVSISHAVVGRDIPGIKIPNETIRDIPYVMKEQLLLDSSYPFRAMGRTLEDFL
jgi:hypothetical protein